MNRCKNQQNRDDHFCSVCKRQMAHGESYWRDAGANIVCDECATIDCGGKYEVHPGAYGGWAVVNGERGEVRCSFADQIEAVNCAERLNEDSSLREAAK